MSEVINDSHLEEISNSHCGKWRHLPPHLGLGNIVKDDVDRNNPGDERKKRYDFLMEWKNRKGSEATYNTLVVALEKIDCKEDAEFVKKLITPRSPPGVQTKASDTTDADSNQEPKPFLQLSENEKEELKHQLKKNKRQIRKRYASYVRSICTQLKEKDVAPRDLATFLLKLDALTTGDEQHLKLFAGVRNELKNAETINDIVDLLDDKLYASHVDCEVYQDIVEEYKLCSDVILSYPDHLKAYVEKHKVSEFIDINPAFREMCSNDSEEVTLKFEIDASNEKLGSLLTLKSSIAEILGIKSFGLRLLRVEEGCVTVTFIIPYFVAHHIFKSDKMFTNKEMKKFLGLSTLWLKCCDCFFDFKETFSSMQQHSTVADATSSAEAATSTQDFPDQLDELARKYQKLVEDHQRLTENYREQSNENKSLNQQNADLMRELQTLRRRISSGWQCTIDELEELKNQIPTLRQSIESQIPALKQSIEEKNQQLIAAREEIEKNVRRAKELEVAMEKVNNDLKEIARGQEEETLFYKSHLMKKCDGLHEQYDFLQKRKQKRGPYWLHKRRHFHQKRKATFLESSSLNLGVLSNSVIARLTPLHEKDKSIEAKVILNYIVSYTPESRGHHILTVKVNDSQTEHYNIFVEYPIETIRSPHQTISLPGASRVAVHKEKNMLFTSDPTNRMYHIFDLRSNTLLKSIACGIEIRGIAVDTEGNVYLTSKHWLYKYSSSGERVGAVGSDQPGDGDTSFNNPTGLQVNNDKVYVCDTDNRRICVFTSNLYFLMKFGPGFRLQRPEDIAIGPDDMFFVLDTENRAVVIFEGKVPTDIHVGQQLQEPVGLSYRDNHLFVTDLTGHCFGIYKLTGDNLQTDSDIDWDSDSEYRRFTGDKFLRKIDFKGTPTGICTDTDGYIYITNTTDNTVVVY